jgi:hypothetical protein
MLNKLLELIHKGGSVTPISLATQLDTSPMMVEMMIEELTRRGLLKYSEFQSNCESGSCGTCYLANSCKPKLQKVWTSALETKD